MAYPILAPQNTWFVGKCSQSPTYFTEITIMDSYTRVDTAGGPAFTDNGYGVRSFDIVGLIFGFCIS